MGCFFRLIEQFHTQGEPAYCGLGTVAMVLNALGRADFFRGAWSGEVRKKAKMIRGRSEIRGQPFGTEKR